MDTGRNLGREKIGATKILQYLGPRAKNDFGQLYAHNPQLEGTQLQRADDPNSYLNMDYEMHLGTKIDYLFFQSSRLLQATELQLLQNQCEQERTQILTNLMLALENPRFAGYMLTGNRSMFLETDGSLAWLYHCPKVHSPLHTMNQCYDKIPIIYKGEIRFVDPITRQTYPDALKKFSQNLIFYSSKQEASDDFHYYTPKTEFYVDKMISPEYFKDRFMDTFGPVAYFLEHCGI